MLCTLSLQALQPRSSKYREGMEYCILQHIQNGSYGDVFSIRDKRTGFTCGAKRVGQEQMSHVLIPDVHHPRPTRIIPKTKAICKVIKISCPILCFYDFRFLLVVLAVGR